MEYTVLLLFCKGVFEELGVVACWPGVKELFGLASWLAGLLPGDHSGQKGQPSCPFVQRINKQNF